MTFDCECLVRCVLAYQDNKLFLPEVSFVGDARPIGFWPGDNGLREVPERSDAENVWRLCAPTPF